jgi:SAM-dependent methyltransferase
MPEQSPDEWFSDEAFWAESYPFLFPEGRFAAGVAEVERVLALTGREQGRVLDLACGPGRHSVPLAKRGFAVTGVDHTPLYLEKARAFAEAEEVELELVHSDMRDFVRPDKYDLALSLFTSFGYFEAPEDNQRVLENVFAGLRPGGEFIVDVHGKETLARVFEPTGSDELPEAGLLVQRRRIVEDWGRVECEWILIREGRTRTFRFRHWLYSGTELKAMLARAGFAEIRLCGGLDGAPYGPQARRLVAVARKAE